jgi:hypothetical protein
MMKVHPAGTAWQCCDREVVLRHYSPTQSAPRSRRPLPAWKVPARKGRVPTSRPDVSRPTSCHAGAQLGSPFTLPICVSISPPRRNGVALIAIAGHGSPSGKVAADESKVQHHIGPFHAIPEMIRTINELVCTVGQNAGSIGTDQTRCAGSCCVDIGQRTSPAYPSLHRPSHSDRHESCGPPGELQANPSPVRHMVGPGVPVWTHVLAADCHAQAAESPYDVHRQSRISGMS